MAFKGRNETEGISHYLMSLGGHRQLTREDEYELSGRAPRLARAYVAPTAIVAGDVEIADDASVFFGCAVIAGDGRIVIGSRTNVQDNSILATDRARGDLTLAASPPARGSIPAPSCPPAGSGPDVRHARSAN